ncbi:DeoR/GlpR family DNA-binding transcription regulator [Histidinibacterium aquaticum]|uniref:DeoR/GlpR transcriptional regulator n=1 Tax=Histidinibacterium aquaticum TaxID=2613962 RepID=A0A5J5GRR4_9RHOB|nr:DeoR/GlpR family DNA-binding transcription regulator [Histidinibacterium aquaticum]KAA9010244.1 DeoR/GlpR transcriptional regulator [Histidinibacterium aquaticum]
MHDSTLPLGRRRTIADRLSGGQSVVASDLAREFGVSEDAIRRDLRALAADGLCTRVYGGALPLSPANGPVTERQTENTAAKRALAIIAAGLIRPDSTIFLDTGSTVALLAEVLPPGLRVVTNSLSAANALSRRSDLALFLVGGAFDPETGGCTDAQALAALERYRIDLCFLGACALSPAEGIAGFDMADVEMKRALLDRSAETALMMTADKLGTTAPYPIAPLARLTHLVISAGTDDTTRAALAKAGPQIHLAKDAAQ